MRKEEYTHDGMAVMFDGRRHIATDLELCNDGSYVVHLAVVGSECNRRVPISKVEPADKPAEVEL